MVASNVSSKQAANKLSFETPFYMASMLMVDMAEARSGRFIMCLFSHVFTFSLYSYIVSS